MSQIFKTLNIRICLLLATVLTLSSCKGQVNKEQNINDLNNYQNDSSLGETVTEIGTNGISAIFQDSHDNHWFGSDGAYRFDGNSLIHFTLKDGLCSNNILGIQEDKFGNLYFDTPAGVSKYDGLSFKTLPIIDNGSSQNEWRLDPDDLWFRKGWDEKGPYRYDGTSLYSLEFPNTELTEQFYSRHPNASYKPTGIYSMYKDSKGTLWFGTASIGICRYDGKTISWLYEKHLTETPAGGDFGIRSIIEDKDGYFWFCNPRYRFEIFPDFSQKNSTNYINYKKETGVINISGQSQADLPYFMSVAESDDGDLWMLSYNNGVWQKHEDQLIHHPLIDSETEVNAFTIIKDKQGIIWVGTHNAGLYQYNGKSFEKFNF